MKSIFKTTLLIICFICVVPNLDAQTKRIKRPRSSIGVSSADTFIRESFDLYDKVYKYDGYKENGTPLTDDDFDALEYGIEDAERILATAPNVIADLDGVGVIKQGKATLQVNKAKKALRYCIETLPTLLEERKKDDNPDSQDTSGSQEDSTNDESNGGQDDASSDDSNTTNPDTTNNDSDLVINSKFDFIPGDELLFFDDFNQDFVGDFPAHWNTNGTGEVVTFGSDPQKWFELKSGHQTYFVPDVNGLPEEYTIELDVKTVGITKNTSSAARLKISLEEDTKLRQTTYNVATHISYPQYVAGGLRIATSIPSKDNINNTLQADLRDEQKKVHHISIAVNKRRYRLWVNQQKLIDVPRAMPETAIFNGIKLNIVSFKDGEERFFISNFKVAKGGLDLRRTLLDKGSVSTNGILFRSGSSVIEQQSYGIIKQISQVLQQDTSMTLTITGHTDSDGSPEANITLSQARAQAVLNALVTVYGVNADRLTAAGKGEDDPVADNNSPEGKAKNRRVVFTKQ